jgi:CRISPR/Cas system type I-B associated protein Csh2 (Cas7 group RAMP superfamily)
VYSGLTHASRTSEDIMDHSIACTSWICERLFDQLLTALVLDVNGCLPGTVSFRYGSCLLPPRRNNSVSTYIARHFMISVDDFGPPRTTPEGI